MGARIRTYRLYRTDDLAICTECPEESENHGRSDYEDTAGNGCGSFCRCTRSASLRVAHFEQCETSPGQ